MIRFYTLPPSDVNWPHILINANNPALSYIRKHRKAIKSVIVDSGIEIFRNPEVKDYPKGHIYRIVKLHNYLRRILPDAEVYVTVPDYCDDYHPGSLWLSSEITKIGFLLAMISSAQQKNPLLTVISALGTLYCLNEWERRIKNA